MTKNNRKTTTGNDGEMTGKQQGDDKEMTRRNDGE
jgi:hypothetical protein